MENWIRSQVSMGPQVPHGVLGVDGDSDILPESSDGGSFSATVEQDYNI